MLTANEIEQILERSRKAKERSALLESREDLIKIMSKWNRRSNLGCVCSAEALLDIYHDLMSNDILTITAISKRTGYFPSKISALISILEREGWVKVNRKNKP